jgi:hypothetical protein
MSTMSAPAQHSKSYLTASDIGSYEEDGEFYDREKLGLRPNDPMFMKDDVPKNFEFGKPFLRVQNFPDDIFHSGDSTTGT